jgi:hypothetical protein
MIVLAGLRIEPGSLSVQEEGADLPLLDETVQIAINGGKTDPRQLSMNPLVDLMGERVGMIALESCEHLLQLTRCPFAGRPLHRHLDFYRTERNVSGSGVPSRGSAVKRFSVTARDKPSPSLEPDVLVRG